MRRFTGMVLCGAVLLLALAAPAASQEFSFFGITFGMTRQELDARWVGTGENQYQVPDSVVNGVTVSFDHQKRLYEISFSLDLRINEPPPLLAQAFQQHFDSRWGKDPGLGISVMIGRNENQVTVWHKGMKEAYIRSIQEKIGSLVRP